MPHEPGDALSRLPVCDVDGHDSAGVLRTAYGEVGEGHPRYAGAVGEGDDAVGAGIAVRPLQPLLHHHPAHALVRPRQHLHPGAGPAVRQLDAGAGGNGNDTWIARGFTI